MVLQVPVFWYSGQNLRNLCYNMNSVGQKSSEEGVGADSSNKLWERPWSTNEMRQNAQNWNLAADSGLLKHLQQFSQTVLSRTHATEKALDSLIEDINATATNINNINNGFLCLANTQFVENRVYDDDDKETPQDAPCPEKQSREETEAAMLKRVREALSMSVAVLDTMFEPVELQASDSEGEMEDDLTSGSTLLLEPHNPYYHRQLPHIIGTDAFMSDDRIGLGDSPSDSEEQPIDECLPIDIDASSDSDFDSLIPGNKRGRETGSFQDSESYISDEQSGRGQKKQKKASAPPQTSNLTTVYNIDKPGAEAGSGALGTDNSFAAQLAAKLGGVAAAAAASASAAASQGANEVPPQKTKQTAPVTKTMGKSDDLFGHLPSDGEDDELFSGQHGLFSSRPKLFDDLEDVSNSLWGATPHSDGQSVPTVSATLPTPKSRQSKGKAVDDLFGSSPQDEDDLFSNKPTKSSVTAEKITPIQGVRPKISRMPTLSVGELDPGIATSTPGNSFRGINESEGLFDDASQRSGEISKINEEVPTAGKAVQSNSDHPAGPSETQKKKPTGGVLMFGPASGGLKDKLPPRPQSSSSSSSEGEDKPSASHSSNASSNLIASSTIVSGGSSGLGDSQSNVASIQSQVDSGAFQPIHTSTQLRVPPDDDGYETKKVFPSQRSNTFGGDVDDLFKTTSDNIGSKSQSNTSKIAGSLFAGLEDDDDDLFSEITSSKSKFTSGKASNLIISNSGAAVEKSDDLLSDSRMKHNTNVSNKDSKSEVDGCFAVSGASKEKQETQSSLNSKDHNPSDDSRDIMNSKTAPNVPSFPVIPKLDFFSKDPPPIKSEKKAKKPLSLFDESDSGEDELLFSSASSAGSRRSQASGDLLAFPANTSSEKKPLSKRGLFDDDDALFGSARNDPDVDIFSETSKSLLPPKYTPLHQEAGNRLPPNDPHSSNTSQNKTSHVSKEGTGLPSKQEGNDLPAPYPTVNPNLGSSALSKPSTTLDSLFDDTDDDLFSSRQKSSLLVKAVPTSRPPKDLFDDGIGEGQNSGTLIPTQGVSQVNPTDSTLSISHSSLYSDENLKSESKLSKSPITQSVDSQSSTAPDIVPLPNNSLGDEKEILPPAHRPDKNDFVPGNKKSDEETPPFPASHTQPRKVQPPKTLDIRKTTDPSLRDSDDDDDKLFKSVVPKSGKDVTFKQNSVKGFGLQSALNIDPRALLPGAKPPSKKNASDDHSRHEQIVANVSSSYQIKSEITASVKEEKAEHIVGFDRPIANNATLPSAVKDRVKVSVKRRPPSNKARREAARASQILDNSDTDNSPFSSEGVDATLGKKSAPDSHLSPASNILSPSTDEDDLFGVPQDLPAEYGKQHVPSSDIFSDAPILSPIVPDKGNNLFPAKVDNLFPSVKKTSTSKTCSAESAEKPDFLNEPVSNTASKGNTVFQQEHIESVSSKTHGKVDKSPHGNTLFESSEISPEPARELYPPEHPPVANEETLGDIFSGHERSLGLSVSPSLENSLTRSTSETSLPQKVENLPPEHSHVEPLNAGLGDKLLGTQCSPFSDSNEKHSTDKESKKGLFANIQPVDTDPLKGSETSTSHSISPEGEKMFQNPEDSNHSSLFAFVKKKPDSKHQPLFSKAPVLPTKGNNSSKPKIGILADDDGEDDDDLFSSAKAIPVKKMDSRRKEAGHVKTWHLSDDDDDDNLFQSTKPAKLPSSHNSPASGNVNLSQALNKKSLVSSETKTVSSKTITSGGLFGDENEDDDDLFSQPSSVMKDKLKQSTSNKASLFSSNDDNLFSSSSSPELSSNTKPKGAPSNQKKVPTTSGIRSIKQAGTKLKPENVFDDPLIAMQKNRDE